MGSGTCCCHNSIVNDAISKIHLMGVNCKMQQTQSVSPKRDADREFPVSGRYSGKDRRQVNHSGEITVQRQPSVHQPSPSLFYFRSQQQLLSQDGCTPVGTTWGEAGRCLPLWLSGGKSCSCFTMLAQFYQGTYMDQGSASSFVFQKFFSSHSLLFLHLPKQYAGSAGARGLRHKADILRSILRIEKIILWGRV